jgi:hypothetical protein
LAAGDDLTACLHLPVVTITEETTIDGRQLIADIEKLFADRRAAYLHVHFAAAGCYAARGFGMREICGVYSLCHSGTNATFRHT